MNFFFNRVKIWSPRRHTSTWTSFESPSPHPPPPARALTPSPGKRVNYNPLCPGWNTTQFYKAFIAASRIKDYSYTLPRFSAGLAVMQTGRRERPRAMFLPFQYRPHFTRDDILTTISKQIFNLQGWCNIIRAGNYTDSPSLKVHWHCCVTFEM